MSSATDRATEPPGPRTPARRIDRLRRGLRLAAWSIVVGVMAASLAAWLGLQLVGPLGGAAVALASTPAARALIGAALLAGLQLVAVLAVSRLLGFVVDLPPLLGALGGLLASLLPLVLLWAAQGAGAAASPDSVAEPGALPLAAALGLVRLGGVAGCAAAGACGVWLGRRR